MRFLSIVLRFLGLFLILSFGILLLVLSTQLLPIEEITELLTMIYDSPTLRLSLGIIGAAILFITMGLTQFIVQQIEKEKTIAFQNPDGEVTVTLESIKDFVKKIGNEFKGIKEIRPEIRATRKGILITIKAVLWSDTSIPETTEGLQSMIRSHIQSVLGVEEEIKIHVHVGKVIPRMKVENLSREKVVI